jgi:hypothetical protein
MLTNVFPMMIRQHFRRDIAPLVPDSGPQGAFSALFDASVPGLGTMGAPVNDAGPSHPGLEHGPGI